MPCRRFWMDTSARPKDAQLDSRDAPHTSLVEVALARSTAGDGAAPPGPGAAGGALHGSGWVIAAPRLTPRFGSCRFTVHDFPPLRCSRQEKPPSAPVGVLELEIRGPEVRPALVHQGGQGPTHAVPGKEPAGVGRAAGSWDPIFVIRPAGSPPGARGFPGIPGRSGP